MPEQLRFNQPNSLRWKYEILDGDEITGTLEFKGLTARKADVVIEGEAYRIAQSGLFRTEVVVSSPDSQEKLATYTQSPMARTCEVQIGDNQYTFAQTNKAMSLHSEYAWKDPEGNKVVTFNMQGVVRSMGQIAVADTLAESPDRRLLISLGLFNSLQWEDDDSVGASFGG